MSAIRLIAGLGNIGREHEADRHNAGFWFVDALARRTGASFAKESKFFGEVGKASIDGHAVWLLKPSTYMNRSGRAVGALANFYRIVPSEILVVHDELDLLPGQSKLKQGGGHAGHNGLRDIHAQLGSSDYWRLRLGIGHPRTLNLTQDPGDFVLHPPSRDDLALIEGEIDRGLDVISDAVGGQLTAATMKLHTRPK